MTKSDYFWSEEEIGLLKRAYENGGGLRTATEVLPGKTKGTIAAKACRLKITAAKPRRSESSISSSTSSYSNGDSNSNILGNI